MFSEVTYFIHKKIMLAQTQRWKTHGLPLRRDVSESESNLSHSPSTTVLINSLEGCMNLKSRKALTTLIRKFWGLWKEMGNNEKMQWGVENLDPQGKFYG